MALGRRQTNLFAAEDWKKLYTTFSEADFQSYDFETIRKVMVDYLKTYYAEDFNDFTESSEYIALLDIIAFVAQGLAFRTDLNARENFLETAERRDNVLKLARHLSYNPNRNRSANGMLKIQSITTTENVIGSNGSNLANTSIKWNDTGNPNWFVFWNQIMNAAFSSSQKVGKPYASKSLNNMKMDQYNIAIPNTVVPVFSFNSFVANTSLPFEAVSADILSSDNIKELSPGNRGQFGIVHQQDGRGFASTTNGYFLYFKQGQLQSTDFNINEKLPNRIVEIPVNNINNEDVWLYELNSGRIGTKWTEVLGLNSSNAIYNSTAKNVRTIYNVNSKLNDQIDLIFGDGTFSDMPMGSYRLYFRTGVSSVYRINPSDIKDITISVPYINKNGRPETLSITASLQYTVANSSTRDSLDEIKIKAPQHYYTQNRMVNGEDYNIFPYTRYSDIVKVKSVNRFSSGISRNLDINDPTGKYSATELFADDGALYKEEKLETKTFTFNNRNEVIAAIRNLIVPILNLPATKHLYLDKYSSLDLSSYAPTKWERITDDTSSCTGYFLNYSDNRQLVGGFSSNIRRYLLRNSLIKFEAPTGYYFDRNNVLVEGTPDSAEEKTFIWASVQSQTGNGVQDLVFQGREIGAVTLTENIPTGALVTRVYAPFATVLSNATITTLTNIIFNKGSFGLRFDYTYTANQNLDPWRVIAAEDLNIDEDFNLGNTGDTSSSALDSSWFIRCSESNGVYTIFYRELNYIFSSLEKVNFLNTTNERIYDSKTNTLIKDNIKILEINSKYNSNEKLNSSVSFEVLENIIESDGYNDNSKVLVTFTDVDSDSLFENPEAFTDITSATIKNIFFQKYFDFDNLIRYKLLPAGTISNLFANKTLIEEQKNNYPVGKVFYAYSDDKFYKLTTINSIRTVIETTDYKGYIGRQTLYFQYNHNSNEYKRINPAASNLIDIYILTKNYDAQFRNYMLDYTGKVTRPEEISVFELSNNYGDLFEYKMLTDSLVINSGKYKPLFGSKAASSLQATFQAVKDINSTISDNELKSKIINAVNDYFSLDNWEFGDTFYFSELSAYLHKELSGYLSSIIIVPKNTNNVFGSLFEIRSQPNEIFISAATVEDVEIVNSVLSGINSSGIGTSSVVRGVTY